MEPMSVISAGLFVAHQVAAIGLGVLVREIVYEERTGEHITEYEKREEEKEKQKEAQDTQD